VPSGASGGFLVIMDSSATISELRIEEQGVAFRVTVDGPEGTTGKGTIIVYDALGVERSRTDLSDLSAGQSWDSWYELRGEKLGDGDFTAWVIVVADTVDGSFGKTDEKGVSFMVGRGRVYPSQEVAHAIEHATPPTISPLRLEGSWVVFDMTNPEAYDVTVAHELMIGQEGGTFQTLKGTELLQANATQQAHYLLPADLVDGKYLIAVSVTVAGSYFPNLALAYILVDSGVITVVP
jgi:hypothetical protein